jgi:gas vesicle protein
MAVRFFIGFLLGFMIGACVGLALAPQPGPETRAKVLEQVRQRRQRAGGMVEEAPEAYE